MNTDAVVRGQLYVNEQDLGEVFAYFAEGRASDVNGVLFPVDELDRDLLPLGAWVDAWLTPHGRGPGVAARIRRSGTGGVEFAERRPAPR